MAQSLVLEWLNENEFRSYPLRLVPDKELLVYGLGKLSLGDEVIGSGYRINGAGTSFLSQVFAGDLVQIASFRSVVKSVASNTTLYVEDDLRISVAQQHAKHSYLILKRNNSLGWQDGQVNLTLDNILLDANLVYITDNVDMTNVGKLESIVVSGSNLVIEVYGQEVFTVPNYQSASYPYYVRNTSGSLLVVGGAAVNIQTNLSFANQWFEASTISVMDNDWRGVDSLSFNSGTPLTGNVQFLEGYQVDLTATAPHSLAITAGRLYGTPIGCERIFEDVVSDCPDIISFISSVSPRKDFGDFKLIAGNYLAIYPDSDNHRIYVGLTFNKVDICQPVPPRPVIQI